MENRVLRFDQWLSESLRTGGIADENTGILGDLMYDDADEDDKLNDDVA